MDGLLDKYFLHICTSKAYEENKDTANLGFWPNLCLPHPIPEELEPPLKPGVVGGHTGRGRHSGGGGGGQMGQ